MRHYFITAFIFITAGTLFTSCSSSRSVQNSKGSSTVKVKSKNNPKNLSYTISTIGRKPFVGIGLIVDSATGISRSFAFYELFQNNVIIRNSDTLYPVMVDYPFNAPFAITGMCGEKLYKIKLYENGKRISEIVASKDWKDVYSKINKTLGASNLGRSKFKVINEGMVDNVDARKIKDCLPGSFETFVPYNKLIDTFRRYVNIKYYYSKHAYMDCKDLFGKYSNFNENKLFFFRSYDVPYNLKSAVKPLVFPLYRSLTPSLTYLASGKQLADVIDLGAALNCYYSALNTSNNILASPFERAFVRALAFEQIAKVHKLISGNRLYSSQVFQLGSDLNRAYLNSYDSKVKQKEYYDNISQIENLCTKAEDKAREIRGQKRLGGFLAAVSYAGALSTTSAYDNTTSNAYMSQAETYFTTSQKEAEVVNKALFDQYENIEDMIDAKSFIANDGSKIEIGKSYLADEVYYYLSTQPELVKGALLAFAVDKPKFKELLGKFYSSKDRSVLGDIFLMVSEIEAKVLNAEVRNIPVTENFLKVF